jgi:hypothetical protein
MAKLSERVVQRRTTPLSEKKSWTREESRIIFPSLGTHSGERGQMSLIRELGLLVPWNERHVLAWASKSHQDRPWLMWRTCCRERGGTVS